MTRKDYKKFAVVIGELINGVSTAIGDDANKAACVQEFLNEFCYILKADNSNFDKQRFLDAVSSKK